MVGAGGQLGRELVATVPAAVEVIAADHGRLDVTDANAVRALILRERPHVVINAAGYTAVDRAETDQGTAFAVNARGPANLARGAVEAGARLVHVSTDFVFDGAQSTPYATDATPNPLNAYGRSKLEGERSVGAIAGGASVVIRTAWVYSVHGSNFVKNMLRLMDERGELGVVVDQVGTPTWARGLAKALWAAASLPGVRGTLHWTDAGVASWYDLAVAVQEEALAAGILRGAAAVRPIRTESYPTPARRPAYSVLDKGQSWATLGMTPPHWRTALRQMLGEVGRA